MLPWKITCVIPLIITAVAAITHQDIWRSCKIIGPAIGTKFMGRRKAMVAYGGVLGDAITDVLEECLTEEMQWVTSKQCVKSIVTSGVQMCLAVLDQGYAAGQHGARRSFAGSNSTLYDVASRHDYFTIGDSITVERLSDISLTGRLEKRYQSIDSDAGSNKNYSVPSEMVPVMITRRGELNITFAAMLRNNSAELRHLEPIFDSKRDFNGYKLATKGGLKVFSNSAPIADWDDVDNWLNQYYYGQATAMSYIEPDLANYPFMGLTVDILSPHGDGQMIMRSETAAFGENWETGWDWCFGDNRTNCGSEYLYYGMTCVESEV